jgi:hypothetical protein
MARKKPVSKAEKDRRLAQRLVDSGIPIDPETRLPIIGYYPNPVKNDTIDFELNRKSTLDLEL